MSKEHTKAQVLAHELQDAVSGGVSKTNARMHPLPGHWWHFNTPAGAVIERCEVEGTDSLAVALTCQLIPGAWLCDDRSWTVMSPFKSLEHAEHPLQAKAPLANVAGWIVELEPDTWLASNGSTPELTAHLGNARIYGSEANAKGELTKARKASRWSLANGRVVQVGLVEFGVDAERIAPATKRVLREQVTTDLQKRLAQALSLLESERVAHREALLNMESVEDIDDAIDPYGFGNGL